MSSAMHHCIKMQWITMKRSGAWCDAMQAWHDMTQVECNTTGTQCKQCMMQWSMTQWNVMQYNMMDCNECNATFWSVMQCYGVQCNCNAMSSDHNNKSGTNGGTGDGCLKDKQSSKAAVDGNCIVGRPARKLATDEQKLKKNPKYNNQPVASNLSINNRATKLILVEHDTIQLECNSKQYNAMETNTKQHDGVQQTAVEHNAMQHKTMQWSKMQHIAMQWGMMWCNAVGHDVMQCSGMQHNAMQWSAMQCSGEQCNLMQCNLMWCNLMWCNLMWCNNEEKLKNCSIHPAAIALLATATVQQQYQ